MPKPVKAGDGKLKGLTIPMVGSQLSGYGHIPGKSGQDPQDGGIMKKLNKLMTLLLAVSMICMTSVTSFADEELPAGDAIPCLTCVNAEEGHQHDDSCYTHTWDKGTVTVEATCTEAGTKEFTCTTLGCNGTKTESLPAGHAWNEGETTKEPTCTEKGEKTYTCTVEGCGEMRVEAVAELPHTYGDDDVQTVEATCTEEGSIIRTCSVCKDVKAEAIPIKGHTLEGGICKDCGAQVQLTKGTRYVVFVTDGAKTIRYANYTGGSNSSITLSKRDFPDTKLEVSDGKVKKLAFVGFSNDGGKTIFAAGTKLPGSILECMTPTAENEVYFEAVYKAEDSSDQSYDYSLSGKTVNRRTLYQTSDGISVTVDKGKRQIIVTIPKGYDKKQVSVDATEALMEAWSGTYMPGGAGAFFSIVIDNQSDKEFKYKNGSFIIQSPSFTPDGNTFDFENEVYGYITGARTFDGETPYYTYGAIRTSNEALKALYKTSGKLTVRQLLDSQLGNMLKEYGYENGIDDLAEYYLDYINAKKGTSYTNLNQVPDIVLTSDGPFGGYVVNSDAKESNPEIAGAGYSYFYNRLLSVVPQDNPKDATGAFSFGNYMSGEASYESYCNKDWAAIGKDQQAALTAMGFYINGPYCTNPYQNMDFGFEIGFQLTSENEDPTPIDPPPYIPPVDPTTPVDPPVDPDQPLPPDENLEDPDQPLPPDENLEDPDQPSQDLPDDEHLESDDPVKQVKSENPDQPKTGDESQLAFYLIIAMSACGALSVTVRRKRRTK